MIRNMLPISPRLAIAEMGYENYHQYGGLLIAPSSWRSRDAVSQAPLWAMDNGAFTGFDADKFRRQMDRMQGLPKCQFVVVPDVVANHIETLKLYHAWHAEIRDRGYPRAFVLQNGVALDTVPYDLCEAVFIGGTTAFKSAASTQAIVREAKRRNKWVHIGRVNTPNRVIYSMKIGCDSWDGTTYAIDLRDIFKHLNIQLWYERQLSLL